MVDRVSEESVSFWGNKRLINSQLFTNYKFLKNNCMLFLDSSMCLSQVYVQKEEKLLLTLALNMIIAKYSVQLELIFSYCVAFLGCFASK